MTSRGLEGNVVGEGTGRVSTAGTLIGTSDQPCLGRGRDNIFGE